MTLDEVLAVLNQHFASAQEPSVALTLLDAQTDMRIAQAKARIVTATASAANTQAELMRQQPKLKRRRLRRHSTRLWHNWRTVAKGGSE